MEKVDILGLKVHTVTMAEALRVIDDALRAQAWTQVITLNAEIAYGAWDDPDLAALINNAALVTPDGTGILWAAKQYGVDLKERVCGIDLLTAMMEKYKDGSRGFYFLGAKPEIAAAAAEKIKAQYPALKYCGYHDGYFGKKEEEALAMAKTVRETGAEILIVAMGAPYQDQWIARYGQMTGAAVAIGVGGSLDVISGTLKRAPLVFQKMRLEWLYRLLCEPSRWRRMMSLPKFMRQVKKEVRKSK